jgi:hypothetical protein
VSGLFGWDGSGRQRLTVALPYSSSAIKSRSPSASHDRLRADSLRRVSTSAASNSSIPFVIAGLVRPVAATPTGTVMIGCAGGTSISVASYRTMINLHVDTALAGVPLTSVTPAMLDDLYGRLLRDGRRNSPRNRGRGLSPRTVRYLHTILNRALEDAVRLGSLISNPASAASPPSPRRAISAASPPRASVSAQEARLSGVKP